LFVLAGSAPGAISVDVTLYETGVGTEVLNGGAPAIPFALLVDGGPGSAGQPVLTYSFANLLPGATLVPGDLLGGNLLGSTQVSDLIRVNPLNQIVFYSGGIPVGSPLLAILKATAGDDDPGLYDLPNSIADTTAWPTALYNNQVLLSSEIFWGGVFDYHSGIGQPGYDSSGTYDITYHFVSDVTPEPSTLTVWSLLGTLALGLGWWRKRKAA